MLILFILILYENKLWFVKALFIRCFAIFLIGVILEALSLWVYPGAIVRPPEKIVYHFGLLYFSKIVFYTGSFTQSPPQLDYLQLFTIITFIYFVIKKTLHHS
ncbi:hypothetical protein B9Q02_05465 [Candidatus Marsarchaeota G1 archaeon BE_D]|uniref:Uncharacterized protein n=1 Tax=Candidatus Marsarchaeota G1 archaeon BE_D TaxID=1978156 RepID=A0A2R6AH56_9ARCH|nr:MAG: hypothetical protein B9Q02_05465 [Candidatus Marsarchaeota G1 archaeon BE_D]